MTTDLKYEDGKLTVTRIFDAPRQAVFEAWVETTKVQQWWAMSRAMLKVNDVVFILLRCPSACFRSTELSF